ncbi:hypothetical protein OAU50_04535, partial [Planctomycetota bacterium]|nr:hypothetical protein [Planctomycetota bacterium]
DTVRAKVEILDPDDMLRKDMTVTVDFHPRDTTTEDGEAPLAVPTGAISKRDGKTFVFIIRDGQAKLTEVELGEEAAFGFPVISGLDNGDVVATSKLELLADGMAISLEEAE